ncbi:MAG: Bug family tripartite tricarboxylate transporter substrate binding protein [Lautropia sp.]
MISTLPRLLAGLLAGAFALATPMPAPAQSGPVSLVVPYPAGGPSDVTARLVASAVAKTLGADVIVENVAGATGAIAIQKVIAAPADGRLLYQGSQNELIIPPLTVKSVRFTPDDLEIVYPITTTRLVLAVRSALPARTLEEFVALARQRAASAPLSYGSPGVGSLYHLIPERMARLAGAQFNHVPYKGTAPMMQDLIGDRIDFTVMAFSTALLPQLAAKQFRVIAHLSADKPAALRELPSVSELAVFKDVDYASNAGYFVRRGTPAAIKQRLNRALDQAVAGGTLAEALEADGRLVYRNRSIADAEAFYRAEVAKYRRIVAETGFQPLD